MTSGFSVFANSISSLPGTFAGATGRGRTMASVLGGSSPIMTSSRSEARDLACSIVGPRQILRPFGYRMTSVVGFISILVAACFRFADSRAAFARWFFFLV